MAAKLDSPASSSIWQRFSLGMRITGFVALVVVVVVAVTAWWDSERPVTFKLSFGEGKMLKIEVPREGLTYTEMVRQLMRNDTEERRAIRGDVLALLALNHGIHELKNPKTVGYIRGLDYYEPFMVELRREIISGQLNMWPREQLISLSHSDGIPVSRAAVCNGSEFFGNYISLFSGTAGTIVQLLASLPFENEDCRTHPNKWIQISTTDRSRFDGQTLGITAKVEPRHYSLAPRPFRVASVGHRHASWTQGEN